MSGFFNSVGQPTPGNPTAVVGAVAVNGTSLNYMRADAAPALDPTILASIAVGANPTASVGLSAVNGSATTFMRSDGAPPIDQGIAPTWLSPHVFSALNPGISIANSGPRLWLNKTDAAADGKIWDTVVGATTLTERTRTDVDGAGSTIRQITRSGTTVTKVSYPTDTASAFDVGPAPGVSSNNPRMRVTTAVASANAAQFTNAGGTNSVIVLLNPVSSTNSGFIEFRTNFSNLKGSVTYNSGTDLVAYNTTSDARLKENVRESPSAGSVIDKLKVVSFEWISNGYTLDYWMVAQQVFDVFPMAVNKPANESEEFWSVDVSKLVPLMLKEIQELRGRVLVLEKALRSQSQ